MRSYWQFTDGRLEGYDVTFRHMLAAEDKAHKLKKANHIGWLQAYAAWLAAGKPLGVFETWLATIDRPVPESEVEEVTDDDVDEPEGEEPADPTPATDSVDESPS